MKTHIQLRGGNGISAFLDHRSFSALLFCASSGLVQAVPRV